MPFTRRALSLLSSRCVCNLNPNPKYQVGQAQREAAHPSRCVSQDDTYGDPLGITARHSPTGRGKTPKAPSETFLATASCDDAGVKTASQMNPALPAKNADVMADLFAGADRLEYSAKRVSEYDPNTFHTEAVILKPDGTYEHRDAAEWYVWKNGEDKHDGWISILIYVHIW